MQVYPKAVIDDVKRLSPAALNAKWFEYAGRNLSFTFTFYHLSVNYPLKYPKFIGSRFDNVLVYGKGKNWVMYRVKSEIDKLRFSLREKLDDKSYIEQLLNKVEESFEQYVIFCNSIPASRMPPVDFLKEYYNKLGDISSAVSTIIEICNALSLLLEDKLTQEEAIQLAVPPKPTLQFEQERDLLKCLIEIKEKQLQQTQADALLRKHYDNCAFVYFYVDDPILPFEQFIAQNSDLLSLGLPELRAKLAEKMLFSKTSEAKIAEIIGKHSLDQQLVALFRRGIHLRIYGESVYGLGNKASYPKFVQVAKELGVGINQVKYLTVEEMQSALEGSFDPETIIRQRQHSYAVLLSGQNAFVLSGKECDAFFDLIDIERSVVSNSSEVKGLAAVRGKVIGTVRIVNDVSELDKVQHGDVMVTRNTTPTFVPAMKRAIALITDEGGITCHAAIVSRELGLPCIIGTGNATVVLKDGVRVEVNATVGTVKKL